MVDHPILHPMHTPGDAGRIPLYVRLANLFRDTVVTGRWGPNTQLPTIPELCEQFGVSRITVRQALQVLVKEGLITSTSGKGTFVTDRAASAVREPALRRAINDSLRTAEHETMKVLRRDKGAMLPLELQGKEATYPSYVRVRKVHFHRGQPFQVVDTYVATPVYRRFPRNADEKEKTARLLRDHGGVAIKSTRQEMTLAYADADVAAKLNCGIASVLVRIRRWRIDETDRLVYAAMNYYRGDLFVLEIETSSSDTQAFAPGLIPTSKSAAA